jgi:hypothetical protein
MSRDSDRQRFQTFVPREERLHIASGATFFKSSARAQ